MSSKQIVSLILRASLAFAFIYPAVNAYFDPDSWIGYFPSFMQGYVSEPVLLHSFGILEISLSLWVLSGWKIRFPAMVMALTLLAIVMFNLTQFQIVFRDLSIAGIALALVFMEGGRTKKRKGMQVNLDS
jgi:uncharacterized membrane protein YphA (DoxX/SURF4 family)